MWAFVLYMYIVLLNVNGLTKLFFSYVFFFCCPTILCWIPHKFFTRFIALLHQNLLHYKPEFSVLWLLIKCIRISFLKHGCEHLRVFWPLAEFLSWWFYFELSKLWNVGNLLLDCGHLSPQVHKSVYHGDYIVSSTIGMTQKEVLGGKPLIAVEDLHGVLYMITILAQEFFWQTEIY